jgi:hypothetical protein
VDLETRLAAANACLSSFAKESRIERRRGGFYVIWTHYWLPVEQRKTFEKRWCTRPGQDFYPPWSNKWPHGGTATTALSQLIRWCRGQPVLPISTWRWWASDKCKLLTSEAVERLLADGYPEHALCVLCQEQIDGGPDWWNLDGVSGPCCGWTSGCRQQPPSA